MFWRIKNKIALLISIDLIILCFLSPNLAFAKVIKSQTKTKDLLPDSYTKLLLHTDASSGSTTFTDSLGHKVSMHGQSDIEVMQDEFGGASVLFDGSSSYLSIPDSSDWAFGQEDFTIDFWVRFSSANLDQYVCFASQFQDEITDHWEIKKHGINDGHLLSFNCKIGGSQQGCFETIGPWVPLPDNWYHIAFVRCGSQAYVFINGKSQQLRIYHPLGDISDIAGDLNIGRQANGHYYLNGYLDNFKISKGIARWTADFALPDDSLAPQNLSLYPVSGSSKPYQAVVFKAIYSDPEGADDIAEASLLINTAGSFKQSFYGYYNQVENKLYLRDTQADPSRQGWLGGFAPGSDNSINNGFSILHCAKTSVEKIGNNLIVNWSIAFTDNFTGHKEICMLASDKSELGTGRERKGEWDILLPSANPKALGVSFSPKDIRVGEAATFEAEYSDQDGFRNLRFLTLAIGDTPYGKGVFSLTFNQEYNCFMFKDDFGNDRRDKYLAPGADARVDNSFAVFYFKGSEVIRDENKITLKIKVNFKDSFLGLKKIYLYAVDMQGNSSEWKEAGTINILK